MFDRGPEESEKKWKTVEGGEKHRRRNRKGTEGNGIRGG